MSVFKEKPLGETGAEIIAGSENKSIGSIVIGIKKGKALIGYVGVKPGERRKGIGSMLIEKAENWASEKGCGEISGTLIPVPGSEESIIRLLEKRGYDIDKNGRISKKL